MLYQWIYRSCFWLFCLHVYLKRNKPWKWIKIFFRKVNKHGIVDHFNFCLQSTVVTDLCRLGELDSDMADITQSLPAESVLGGEDEEGELPLGETDLSFGKLGGVVSVEHDCISASSHIASSLGINPHTLQVNDMTSITCRKSKQKQKNVFSCYVCR